jgi:hypothetical protein
VTAAKLTVVAALTCAGLFEASSLGAHDDGRFENSRLKPWFEHLASRRGLCCAMADGHLVDDPDWTIVPDQSQRRFHYRVRINGPWIDVPDDAVITERNRVGKAMVWVVFGDFGMSIQCFLPGGLT